MSRGKFGSEEHIRLIKEAVHRIIDRYYGKYSKIQIENKAISMQASFDSSMGFGGFRTTKKLHPDVVMNSEKGHGDEGSDTDITVVVECETTKHNMLDDRLRMLAYEMLREDNPNKDKLKMYIAFPKELKGEVEKPEFFNDLWFFDIGGG